MSLSIRISDQAKVDLLEIWLYIAKDNILAADNMVDKIVDSYSKILAIPNIGISRADIKIGSRTYLVSPYLIFYRWSNGNVDILRVIHGSRDLEALFELDSTETFRMEDT